MVGLGHRDTQSDKEERIRYAADVSICRGRRRQEAVPLWRWFHARGVGCDDARIPQDDLSEQRYDNQPGHLAGTAEERTPMREQNWRDFLRMKVFVRPYAWQLGFMILIGLAGSALGLVQ